MTIALIAHGGAGNWRPGSEQDAIDGMKAAVEEGRAILRAGGSALDAVCATVVVLEDNPIFNAGTGAVLNFDGFCELDASVMVSRDACIGAVAALQRVKNPILVARKVMEETDHVMLAGEGAQRFARVMGFPDHDPVTAARKADWQDKRKRVDEVLGKHSLKMRRFLKDHPEYAGGTVGAVAVDKDGILAAASTPWRSTAAAPTVPPAYSGCSFRKRRILRLCLPSTSSTRALLSC
ncbi:MAG: isoaspartyl peptidase/L-asparaginase, partial [Usitatibacter sp.]